ncbi:MAG: response regulator [Epulopiscium sp.]|nr:response regulator [Candidatus Epulonipiscium sp.]
MFKVLLVDDEPLVLEGLKTMIDWEKFDFSICLEATNGEDALEIIREVNPHLVVTDINMPIIDGLRLIKEANEIPNLRTKFVILSGYSDFEYAKAAMYYGVNHYILKPIDVDEIEEILEKLNNEFKSYRLTQEANEEAIAFITENTINRITNGEGNEGLFKKAEILLNIKKGIHLRYILLEIDDFNKWMNDLDDREIKQGKDKIKGMIKEIYMKNYDFGELLYIYEKDMEQLGIIILDKTKDDSDLKKFLREIRQKLMDVYGISILFFISNLGKGIETLRNIYNEANETRNYRFFNRTKSILFYKDIKKSYGDYEFNREDLNIILECIYDNKKEDIKNGVRHIFNKFYNQKTDIGIIESYITFLKVEMLKKIYEYNGDAEEFTQNLLNIKIDIKKDCFIDIIEITIRLCLYGAEYISHSRTKDSSNIIYEIKKYIQENYPKNLKLREISEKFYMNPMYLGQLFKKSTGMYFNEYLHHIRIKEAKRLLQTTDMKISDIARTIGYKDAEYFSNKFKSYTQVVPSAYKNLK